MFSFSSIMITLDEWEAKLPDQAGKTILITGANAGLGFEDAKFFARKGAHVIMACRDLEKASQAMNAIIAEYPASSLEIVPLDLADFTSIDACAAQILESHSTLDVLINNAGVVESLLDTHQKTAQGFELSFGVNHLGHFKLTAHMLPLLFKSISARIVVLSSLSHRFGKIQFDDLNIEKNYTSLKAYSQSKLANLLFVFELQMKLSNAGKGILAVASHPGWADTHPNSGKWNWQRKMLVQSPLIGTLSTIYAAAANDVVGGAYYGPGGGMEMFFIPGRGFPKRIKPSKSAKDPALATKLWSVSEELTNTYYDPILRA
jgi:NAD(P)-dependent dehydrogenase (short-subunit alcohol dehydrogenase family)